MVSQLSKSVFRCILEYQQPNELLWRYSDPYLPIQDEQNTHFPAVEQLSYDNYLFSINEYEFDYMQFQFTLLDGANCGSGGSGNNWTSLQITQPQAQLQKVQIGYGPLTQQLYGLKFYCKDGAVVLKTGYNWVTGGWCKTHTVHLEDGERVIGYKTNSSTDYAYHLDFQLIIGRPI